MNNTDFYQNREFLFTSESVSEGHPDKVADQISDALLDAYLTENPYARVAVETLVTTNHVTLAGEVRGSDKVTQNADAIVRDVVKRIGYAQKGFHHQHIEIINKIHGQSADIAMGVDAKTNQAEGAGDQGLMFGYACNETDVLMPASLHYSHEILRHLFKDINNGSIKGLGPDAKTQVTLAYCGNQPVAAHSIVLSIQHEAGINQADIQKTVMPYIEAALPKGFITKDTEFFINPTGQFIIGGPDGDAGLTGRKIVVDTYGGAAPHGGGAFSGKDPTKVDRSAAYAARYLAKNVVAAKLADACTIQLAYAIGVAKPLSLYVNTHGTGTENEYVIAQKLQDAMDLTPWGLREHLGLHKPIYERTATYGHFGREPQPDGGFSWEKTDLFDK